MTYRDDQAATELRVARLERRLAGLRDDEAWLLRAHEEQAALEDPGVFEETIVLSRPMDPQRLKALANQVYDTDGRLHAVDGGWAWRAERGKIGSVELTLQEDRLRLEDRIRTIGLGYATPVVLAIFACSVMLVTREWSSAALLVMSIAMGFFVRFAKKALLRRRAWQWRELNRRIDVPAVRVSNVEEEVFEEAPAVSAEVIR